MADINISIYDAVAAAEVVTARKMRKLYVGIGGNDGNSGLTWAQRKLTLNGAEDIPVIAGDRVIVGPGAYRELLTLDVNGAAGSPIEYYADVTGENTDGIGGLVRITGSDNDQSYARNNVISGGGATRTYRTFRGFFIDGGGNSAVVYHNYGGSYIIYEDCFIQGYGTSYCFTVLGNSTINNITLRRCYFLGSRLAQAQVIDLGYSSAQIDNSNCLIENCVVFGGAQGVRIRRVGGVTVKNSLIAFGGAAASGAIEVGDASFTGGQVLSVYNNIIFSNGTGLRGYSGTADITEDFNTLIGNITDRTNCATGAHSVAYPPLFDGPRLLQKFRFPFFFGELSKWSQILKITGTSEAMEDFWGMTRPVTSSKKSWGPFQATGAVRETSTVYAGSASIKLPDAGEQFLMRIPVSAASTVFSIRCYREADYAGINPSLIIRQPGQPDIKIVDTGAAAVWNLLTVTLTPAASPAYVDISVSSENTATSGSYGAYFDSFSVV